MSSPLLPDDSDPTPDLAPAGEPPAPDQQPGEQGRDRLRAALRRPWSRGQLVAGALLGLVGFAATIQVQVNNQDDRFDGARQSDLIALINTLSLATDRAESEIEQLRETRDSLLDDAESTRTALELASQQVQTLGILTGTVPAVGPGIRVRVESADGAVGADQLINGIQELRNAGAEAVEINDSVRIIAQTGFADTPGEELRVDGTGVEAPYVIDVIGDPFTLSSALDFDGGFIEDVERVGGSVEVDEVDQVEVTSTRPAPEVSFAEPVESE